MVDQIKRNEHIDLGKPEVYGDAVKVGYAPRTSTPPLLLAVVDPKNISGAVAAQVGISAVASILSGGVATGGASFKKSQLAGTTIADAKDAKKLITQHLANSPNKLQMNSISWSKPTRIFKVNHSQGKLM